MKAFRLAWSLLIIPRLFLSLIFFPLFVSLTVVWLQLMFTAAAFTLINRDASQMQADFKAEKDFNILRWVIYGEGRERGAIQVCRWVPDPAASDGSEIPPDTCDLDRLDVAILTDTPDQFDSSKYERAFKGHVDRIHICRGTNGICRPDTVIDTRSETTANTYSVWGLGIMSLGMVSQDVGSQIVQVRKSVDDLRVLFGQKLFHPQGFAHPVSISKIQSSSMLVINFALIVIITLWLAIKAHRKVLDYFVRNGALLPMVAACSKRSFYGALWILTVGRVIAFVGAAVPMTIMMFMDLLGKDVMGRFFRGDPLSLLLWAFALILSMSLATVIASIAELRQRHEILSFLYKYLPILVSLLGGVAWVTTLIFDGTTPNLIRQVITALPIVGMVPVLIAPLFSPYSWLLAINLIATGALLLVTLNLNARWFAAHLEEL